MVQDSAVTPQVKEQADAAPWRLGVGDVLATGFGCAVAMWAVGYVARVFTDAVPPAVLLVLFGAAVMAGGYVLGRWSRRGFGGGAAAGLVTGLINLLVLGSLLGGRDRAAMMRLAAVWLPATLGGHMLLGEIGAVLGRSRRDPARTLSPAAWTGWFAGVAAVATFLLIVAGGLVTGFRAGLSVPDWPSSFQANMFLYPLARMTGGIYYEHAHRLYGSLVGLTTAALAVHLSRVERRAVVKWLAGVAVIAVIAQGVMGGLRVTEAHTGQTGVALATAGDETTLSISLAVAHGTFGQVFFGLMLALAAMCSPAWQAEGGVVRHRSAGADRFSSAAAVACLLTQLLLGALQRHTQRALMLHISFACITVLVVLLSCARVWGLYGQGHAALRRLSLWGMGLTLAQVLLGIAALVAISTPSLGIDAVVTTMHQAVGAALLGQSVLLAAWVRRAVRAG